MSTRARIIIACGACLIVGFAIGFSLPHSNEYSIVSLGDGSIARVHATSGEVTVYNRTGNAYWASNPIQSAREWEAADKAANKRN